MMYCKKCGAQIDDNAIFCPACGTRTNPEPQPVQPQPVYQEPQPAYQEPVAPQGAPEAEPKHYLGKAIAALILCWPFGIPALVNAIKTMVNNNAHNYAESSVKSASAKKWGNVGIIVGCCLWALVLLIYTIAIIVALAAGDLF